MTWSVGDVMTRDVVFVHPDTEFKACVDLLRIHRVSALPVIDADSHVLGVVSEFDLLPKEAWREDGSPHGQDWRRARARVAADVMSAPAVTTSVSSSIPAAARLMHGRRLKRLPVVDSSGHLVGIVSRFDLLKPFLRSDDSIRNEILESLLRRTLAIDPSDVTVDVHEGVVQLRGEAESRSLAELVVRLVRRVEGVVAVESHLGYRFDDSRVKAGLPEQALHLAASERNK